MKKIHVNANELMDSFEPDIKRMKVTDKNVKYGFYSPMKRTYIFKQYSYYNSKTKKTLTDSQMDELAKDWAVYQGRLITLWKHNKVGKLVGIPEVKPDCMDGVIPYKDLDPEIPDFKTGGCLTLFIGKMRCGKTTCLKYIKNKYFPDHFGLFMSESQQNQIYSDLMMTQFNEYFPEIIKEAKTINVKSGNKYNILIAMDDIVSGIKFSDQMRRLCTTYRNSMISTIVSVQDYTLVHPVARANANFVYLFDMTDERAPVIIQKFLKTKFPKELDEEGKTALYRKLCADHHFILIDTLQDIMYRSKIRI